MGFATPISSAGLPPPKRLEAPFIKEKRIIADFEILAKIGHGGMGTVYRARQKSLNRIVALKILPPIAAYDHEYLARFRREAQASGKLVHPNIVQGIAVGQDMATGLWYFAMEYIEGRNLLQILNREDLFAESKVIEIGIAILRALQFAGKHKIVHRDLKPDNILISDAGDIKVADLGLAKYDGGAAKALTQCGRTVGTPHYMAPEQARGDHDDVGIQSDIYALGATLFHLLTGRPPYSGQTASIVMSKQISRPIPLAHKYNRRVGKPLSRLLAQMMQKSPRSRPTPTALMHAFERLEKRHSATRRESTRRHPTLSPAGSTPDRKHHHRNYYHGGESVSVGSQIMLFLSILALVGALGYAIGKVSHKKQPPATRLKRHTPEAVPFTPQKQQLDGQSKVKGKKRSKRSYK